MLNEYSCERLQSTLTLYKHYLLRTVDNACSVSFAQHHHLYHHCVQDGYSNSHLSCRMLKMSKMDASVLKEQFTHKKNKRSVSAHLQASQQVLQHSPTHLEVDGDIDNNWKKQTSNASVFKVCFFVIPTWWNTRHPKLIWNNVIDIVFVWMHELNCTTRP